MVGEPHPAGRVEDEVVRTPRAGSRRTRCRAPSTAPVVEVDALDAPTRVVVGLLERGDHEPHQLVERPAAAVAHVRRAVGADRPAPFGLPPGSATTSTRPSGCTRSTVRRCSSTHSTRAVGHPHRSLGEPQPARDLGDLRACSRHSSRERLAPARKDRVECAHEAPPGTVRRVHAPARGSHQLQREHVLQRVRPERPRRRVLPARQPGQRGLRRDDDVPLPARRADRVHVRPARDHRPTTRSTPAGMRFEVVEPFEELRVSYRGKVVLLDEPLQMAQPPQGVHREPVGRQRRRARVPGLVADVRRRARERRRLARSPRTSRAGSRAATTSSTSAHAA